MKNSELFTTVGALEAAWAQREKITDGKDPKYLPGSILEWACFWEADTALDPKLKPGVLVELTRVDPYLSRYPRGSFGVVVRPLLGYLNQPITKLLVKMADGKDVEIEASCLKPSELPAEVLQLARNQIMEEAKAKCPLYKED